MNIEQASGRPLEVAIVGAGLSGLACAQALSDHGHRVRVFDKGRGAGGRMSTRRAGAWQFDHGAQYFTVRDRRFARWVDAWRQDGIVAKWAGQVVVLAEDKRTQKAGDPDRFVGVPSMSAICRYLASGQRVAFQTRVDGIERAGDRWRLVSGDGVDLGLYDAVVVSAPAPQTAELLAGIAPELAARAAQVEMAPCWAAMVAFGGPLQVGFDAAFVHDSPLSWIARDGSKPSRSDGDAWVLHASHDWSRQHLELEAGNAAESLLEAFREATGARDVAPVHLDAHCWRFALPEPLSEPCLFDADLRLAACGDWCGGPRVEGAFLSGVAASVRLLTRPKP